MKGRPKTGTPAPSSSSSSSALSPKGKTGRPETGPDPAAGEEEDQADALEFYGLKTAAVRSSTFIIRQLHKDVDPALGEAPASIQAAIGKQVMDRILIA